MPESLDAELKALRERAKGFAESTLLPLAGEADARAKVIAAAQAEGFYAMTQPREYGGTAAGPLALTVVREELAAHNPPWLEAVFGPGPGVLANCGEPLASGFLEPMLRGEKRAAFGFTEPEDRPVTGRFDGETLIVNGCKSYVTGGADADFINTLVRIDEAGPALAVVETASPGLEMTQRFESLDGSHHAAFEFNAVRVPRTHIIGQPGEGLPRALGQIGDTRLLIAAQCVGLARWVIDTVTTHLHQPDRKGTPRGAKEGVRLRYADMRIKAFAARSMLYRTARLAENGANTVNEGIMCKVFATEAITEIVDAGIQLVGGGALVVGHPLESLYRRVR
ncbi:MAG: acyl-CoA/acyl-ACP dehydrogenase, partial [Gammaproteobacteria bacterium]|nr:acyl-CoA/acyl-ACP dehydrogenase [Gammaproteobacteria bacterium]